jgi:hypothetical protein
MKTKNTIIHVEFHDGSRKGEHHYFGSITAIFDKIPKNELKTSIQMLYRFNMDIDKPFTNKICTIRKGIIYRKPGNRTAPVKVIRVQG